MFFQEDIHVHLGLFERGLVMALGDTDVGVLIFCLFFEVGVHIVSLLY